MCRFLGMERFCGTTAGCCSNEVWGGKQSENGQNMGPLNVKPLLRVRGSPTGYHSLKQCGPTPFLFPVGGVGRRGAATDPSASALPVSGVHQLRSQTELLQGLVADHHDDGGGRGGNDACRQPFGHPPAALLPDQLPERLHDRRSSFNLSRADIQRTCMTWRTS